MSKLDELPVSAKALSAVGIALVVGGLGYFFWLSGLDKANQEALTALKAKQAENAQLKVYEPLLADLERNIATLQTQMEIQKKIVPSEKEVDQFIHLMQNTASATEIEIRRFGAKPVVRKEYYTEVPFDMEVDGRYYAVLNFMDRVAKLERIVNMDGLKMTALKGKGGSGKYDYNASESVVVTCTAKTFFSNDAPAATATAPGAAAATPAAAVPAAK